MKEAEIIRILKKRERVAEIKDQNFFGIVNRIILQVDQEGIASEISELFKNQLVLFVETVCLKAENKMIITGKLEGAHYAAMKELLAEVIDGS